MIDTRTHALEARLDALMLARWRTKQLHSCAPSADRSGLRRAAELLTDQILELQTHISEAYGHDIVVGPQTGQLRV